jgi:hypothetical protein
VYLKVEGTAAAITCCVEDVFISANADLFLTVNIPNLEKYYGRGMPRGVTLRVNGLHVVLIVSIHPQSSRLALTHSSGTLLLPECVTYTEWRAAPGGMTNEHRDIVAKSSFVSRRSPFPVQDGSSVVSIVFVCSLSLFR